MTRNTEASPGPVDRNLTNKKSGAHRAPLFLVVGLLLGFDAFKADDDLGRIAQ